MTGHIVVQNEAGYIIEEVDLRRAGATVVEQQGAPLEAGLTIVLVEDAEMQVLNRQYRGVDAPTDVLSFPTEAPPVELVDEPVYLGDLVVAYPYAAAQARREGYDLMSGLCLLVIHGTLHLLGFDHDNAANRAAMWAAQDKALAALNIPLDIVPALETYEQEQSHC